MGDMLKKVKEFLLSRDAVLCALVAMGIRALFVEPGIGFAMTVMAFAGLVGYDRYLKHVAKPDPTAELKDQVETLQNHISGLMMKNASRPGQMAGELKRFF